MAETPTTKHHIELIPEHVVSDAACWESYLSNIDANVADPVMRGRLRKAVLTMRRHLGEDWPSRAKDSNLLRWFLWSVSGAVSDYLLVIWGDAITASEDSAGFGRMVTKLRRPGRIESPIAELEVAGRLADRGCRVQFEPEVGGKRPDMLCRCDGSEFLVEVKTLGIAPRASRSMETLAGVTEACRPLHPVGSIFRILAGMDMEKATVALRQAANKAVSSNVPAEVYLPKDLMVYLAPDGLPDQIRMINEWRRKQEASGMIPRSAGWMAGPPYRGSPERRVRVRINELARKRQIPPDRTGVLAVKGPFLFADADAAERPVRHISEALRRINNVPAVVLVSEKSFGGSDEPTITDRPDFTFIRNRLHEMVYEDVVIVRNPYCEPGFDHDGLKRMLAADVISAA